MIGIYARISREKEDIDRSIQNQIKTGIELAKDLKENYEVYQEADGTSGSLPIEKRPELKRLLSDIESGKIHSVFAYDQSRLERDVVTNMRLRDKFTDNNIKLYYQSGLQVHSIESAMSGDILSRINQYHIEKTKKLVKDHLLRNAMEGRRFAFLQFGFTTDQDKKLLINEEEAQIVRRVFALSLEGKGTSKIAEILNQEGIPTCYNKLEGTYKVINKYTGEVDIRDKKSTKWKGGTIRGLITNPIYKGERRWNNTSFKVPAILDDWYWQRVNDNLSNNSNNKGQAVKHSYLLKGLLRCGKCGANYYGKTRVAKDRLKPKDNYYMCSSKRRGEQNCGNRSINIDALDKLIWSKLVSDGRLRKLIKHHFENTDVNIKLKLLSEDIDKQQGELNIITNKRSQIYLNLDKWDRDINEANDALEFLKRERERIEKNITELTLKRDELSNVNSEKDILLNGLVNLDKLDLADKISLLWRYIKNIEISYIESFSAYVISIEFRLAEMSKIDFLMMYPYKFAFSLPQDYEKIINGEFSEADLNFEFIDLTNDFDENNKYDEIKGLEILGNSFKIDVHKLKASKFD